jgi:hypothetical protein
VIDDEIVSEMVTEMLYLHLEYEIAALQNEIRSLGMPSAGSLRSMEHEIAQRTFHHDLGLKERPTRA